MYVVGVLFLMAGGLAGLVALTFLPAKELRGLGLKVLGFAAVLIAAGSLWYFTGKSEEERAWAAGFASSREQSLAKAAGINSPAAWNWELKDRSERAAAEAHRKEQAAKAEEARCLEQLECVGNKKHIAATMKCKPNIENMAQIDFQWTDTWSESKFSRFKFRDIQMKVITYIGDKIQFQNGNGAWVRYLYECDYNVENGGVEDIRVRPGRLPS